MRSTKTKDERGGQKPKKWGVINNLYTREQHWGTSSDIPRETGGEQRHDRKEGPKNATATIIRPARSGGGKKKNSGGGTVWQGGQRTGGGPTIDFRFLGVLLA